MGLYLRRVLGVGDTMDYNAGEFERLDICVICQDPDNLMSFIQEYRDSQYRRYCRMLVMRKKSYTS